MVDERTKAWLEQMSEDAPALGKLLGKALNDGVISPDIADALALAAHNINADVADALIFAASRINYEVADLLSQAAQGISEEAADSIRSSVEALREERKQIEQLPYSIRNAVADFDGSDYSDYSEDSASYRLVEADYPWTAKLKIFSYGLLAGFILLGLPPLYYMLITR